MNGVDLVLLRNRDDPRNIQIRFDRPFARSDLIGLVGLEAVQRQAILLRINRHRAQAKFIGRAEDANRDFAPVCREQFTNGPVFFHTSSSVGLQGDTKFYILS